MAATNDVINLTCYGQPISGITWPVASTVLLNATLQDPQSRTLIPNTVVATLALASFDLFGVPVEPALWTLTGVNTDDGVFTFTIPPLDSSTLKPGVYAMDLWVTLGSTLRQALLPLSQVTLTGSVQLGA